MFLYVLHIKIGSDVTSTQHVMIGAMPSGYM